MKRYPGLAWRPAHGRQRGLSLIATMVGMVLSLLATLALLYAYRGIVLNATSSGTRGSAQAQVAGALLASELLLQQAGYGIGASATPVGASANTDVVLLSGATVSAAGSMSGNALGIDTTLRSGNALVWDTAISGSTQCSALVFASGGLLRYGPVACAAGAAAWASLAWGAATSLVQPGVLGSSAELRVARTACWPFHAPADTLSRVQVQLAGLGSSVPGVCLTNVPN